MTDNELLPSTAVIDITPIGADALQRQVNAIQKAMGQVMKPNLHYGVIPGCGKKPALFKPGAEKLAMMFRLIPSLHIDRADLAGAHREYTVICTLKSPDGLVLGQGLGSCSTMETKYRYRRGGFDVLPEAIPDDYKTKKADYQKQGLGAKKDDVTGAWLWVKYLERSENADIADVYNTVLKMAKKRALVDAVLTATAASDIFEQDIDEDIDDYPPSVPDEPRGPSPEQLKKEREAKERADAEMKLAQLQAETWAAVERGEAYLYSPKNITDQAAKRKFHEIVTSAGGVWDKGKKVYWVTQEQPELEKMLTEAADIAPEAQNAPV